MALNWNAKIELNFLAEYFTTKGDIDAANIIKCFLSEKDEQIQEAVKRLSERLGKPIDLPYEIKEKDLDIYRKFKAFPDSYPTTLYLISLCYRFGLGITRDENEAYQHLLGAESSSNLESVAGCLIRTDLGRGIGQSKNDLGEKVSDDWLKKCIAAGFSPAGYHYALKQLSKDSLNSKDAKEAYENILRAAESGYPEALHKWGMLQVEGNIDPQSMTSQECFEKASALGHINASFELGKLWEFPKYAPSRNVEKARDCYRLASKAGHMQACLFLGISLLNSAGNKYNEGKILLNKVMVQSRNREERLLAEFYLGKDLFFKKDPEGIDILNKIAASGAFEAIELLGKMHSFSEFEDPDFLQENAIFYKWTCCYWYIMSQRKNLPQELSSEILFYLGKLAEQGLPKKSILGKPINLGFNLTETGIQLSKDVAITYYERALRTGGLMAKEAQLDLNQLKQDKNLKDKTKVQFEMLQSFDSNSDNQFTKVEIPGKCVRLTNNRKRKVNELGNNNLPSKQADKPSKRPRI